MCFELVYSSSQCKKFNLLREGFWWENSKQMPVPAQFLLVQHVKPVVLKVNYSSKFTSPCIIIQFQ